MGQARDWWDDQILIKEAVAEAARDAERSHAELVRWGADTASGLVDKRKLNARCKHVTIFNPGDQVVCQTAGVCPVPQVPNSPCSSRSS